MADAAEITRQYDAAQLRALAAAEGLRSQGNRIQCPARCSDDPRGATVGTREGVGVFHCKHGCGASGSAVNLIALARSIPIAEAFAVLDQRGTPPPPPRERKRDPIDSARAWERLARTDVPGIAYLESRGLGLAVERELVRFNVGACGEWWVDNHAKTHRLAMPLRDNTGSVRSFQIRATVPLGPEKKTKLNLPGASIAGLCFGDPLTARSAPLVYLTEGIADTLALQLAGVVVIGAPGADQVRHLLQHVGVVEGRTIVLCSQNDAQHHKSETVFAAIARELRGVGAVVRQLVTPAPHKDPAEWLQTAGLEAFTSAVKAACDAPPPALTVLPGGRTGGGPGDVATKPLRLTDLGNAERLVARHGQDLRYCHTSKVWSTWTGQLWARDTSAEVMRRAKDTVRTDLVQLALDCQSAEVRDAVVKHQKKSESANALRSMVHLAACEPGVPVEETDFDRDPWLLNLLNGTLDLRTGHVRDHRRDDLLSKLAPVAYDPAATCPRWEAFLNRIFAGNAELTTYIQRFTGYCLTGLTGEHVLHVLYGRGRNGKGTYRDTVAALLGSYVHEASFETFLDSKHVNPGAPREDLVALKGARFVAASETKYEQRLDEALVKRLTGEDPITARRLNEGQITFRPVAKYVLLVNDKPVIRNLDEGIRARMRLVPFDVRIPDGEQDHELRDKLRAELPGVLNWAIRGCLDYQRSGLRPPQIILDATKEYLDEMDLVGRFLDDPEECLLDPQRQVLSGQLYQAFERWCEAEGRRPFSQTRFGRELTQRGLADNRDVVGRRVRKGIGLVTRQAEMGSSNPSNPSRTRQDGNYA